MSENMVPLNPARFRTPLKSDASCLSIQEMGESATWPANVGVTNEHCVSFHMSCYKVVCEIFGDPSTSSKNDRLNLSICIFYPKDAASGSVRREFTTALSKDLGEAPPPCWAGGGKSLALPRGKEAAVALMC